MIFFAVLTVIPLLRAYVLTQDVREYTQGTAMRQKCNGNRGYLDIQRGRRDTLGDAGGQTSSMLIEPEVVFASISTVPPSLSKRFPALVPPTRIEPLTVRSS